MKSIKIYTLITLLAILLVNCKKDNDPGLSAQQKATQNLSVTWGNAEVLSSPGGSYGTLEDLVLTFEANGNLVPIGFSATGAPEYFVSGANSTWAWANATTTRTINLLNVSPVQALTVESLSNTNLTISFTYNGPEGGRVHGIGEYRVRLRRQ